MKHSAPLSSPPSLATVYDTLCRPYVAALLAEEINSFSPYYDAILQWDAASQQNAPFWEKISCPQKVPAENAKKRTTANELHAYDPESRKLILLAGTLNHCEDIQGLLFQLQEKLSSQDRACLIIYNSYLRIIYSLANKLGIRQEKLPNTFFTQKDLHNFCALTEFDLVRARPIVFFPFRLLGIGTLFNKLLQAIPFVRWLAFAEIVLLRPKQQRRKDVSLSIIVPARNEKGNIAPIVQKLKSLQNLSMEIIFVEGHSSDGTWEEIQHVQKLEDSMTIHSYQQSGIGKADAVRLGIQHAHNELIAILDADGTSPPKALPRFYEAYISGRADFVNGNRLVYPMNGQAMQFLNWLGNIFFAKTLSFILDANYGDTLCGTKLFSRKDYERFRSWRKDFGDFDPFGDFELLFPAAILGLKSIDLPIAYGERTYGTTNISRFRHGMQLLKMTFIGFIRVRMGIKSLFIKR